MGTDSIVGALTAADADLSREAAALVVDHVLAQPLAQLVEPAELSRLCILAFDEPQLERAVERHIERSIVQLRAKLAAEGGTVGDAVPTELHGKILDLIGDQSGPRLPWLRGALDPALLRDLLAPVFQDVLVGFAGKVPGAIGGAAGGAAAASAGALMGALGSSARSSAGRLFSAGRSVVGGLGKDLESNLRHVAKDFSRGAVSGFQESLRKRLRSQEGKEILSELQQGAFEHVLSVELSDIVEDIERLDLGKLLALLPPLVAHNLGRDVGQAALAEALQSYFDIEGQRPLGELLDDWGVRESIREIAVQRGETVARDLFGSEAFRGWLDRVLQQAGD